MTAILKFPSAIKEFTKGRSEFIVDSGRSIREIISDTGVDPVIIALVVVNGVQESKEYIVKDDDVIKALAIIGGG